MKKFFTSLLLTIIIAAGIICPTTVTAFQNETMLSEQEEMRVDSIFQTLDMLIQEFDAAGVYKGISMVLDTPKLFTFWDKPEFENLQETMLSNTDKLIENFNQSDYLEQVAAEAFLQQQKQENAPYNAFQKGSLIFTSESTFDLTGTASGMITGNAITVNDTSGKLVADISFAPAADQPGKLLMSVYDPEKDKTNELSFERIDNIVRMTDNTGSTLDLIYNEDGFKLIDSDNEVDFDILFNKEAYTITAVNNIGTEENPSPTSYELMLNPETSELSFGSAGMAMATISFDKEAKAINADVMGMSIILSFDDMAKEITAEMQGDAPATYKLVFDEATNAVKLGVLYGTDYMDLINLSIDKAANSLSATMMGETLFSLGVDKAARTLSIATMGGAPEVIGAAELLKLMDQSTTLPEDEEILDGSVVEEPADTGEAIVFGSSPDVTSQESIPVEPTPVTVTEQGTKFK